MRSEVERNLDEFQAWFPPELSFTRRRIDDEHYECSNGKCVLTFYFERFNASSVIVLVRDPRLPDDEGMRTLVLRHLFHAKERQQEGESRFSFLGRTIVNDLTPLLQGDFGVRKAYEKVEDDFFDRIDKVLSLPADAPARRMYDQCDIGWLDAVRR